MKVLKCLLSKHYNNVKKKCLQEGYLPRHHHLWITLVNSSCVSKNWTKLCRRPNGALHIEIFLLRQKNCYGLL